MMNRDPRLERYLSSLESALKPFPVSDRAEIITEIKSHVLDALERDSNSNLETILAALGEPEIVANRYLMERGLKTAKPSISPIVKWLIIGFLGTVAMTFMFLVFLFTRFSPVVQVNDRDDKVRLFNGLIQVDGDKGNFSFNRGNENEFSGETSVTNGQPVSVLFANGNIEFEGSDKPMFTWKCEGQVQPGLNTKEVAGALSLDLSEAQGLNCEISIPKDTKLSVTGANGNLEFANVAFNVNAELANGNIEFDAGKNPNYRFETKTEAGTVANFVSSDTPDAYEIKLKVQNGNIDQ